MPDEKAPKGKLFVCLACGKTSRTKYGDREAMRKGWDVSCVLNSDLYDQKRLVMDQCGRVEKIREERRCTICHGCLPPGETCRACGRTNTNQYEC